MSTSGAAPAPILTEAELKLLQALVYQERGLLHRTGSLHAGHAGHRRAGLLLPAQSIAHRFASAQTAGAAAVAGGSPGQRHRLLRTTARAGRQLQRESD